MPIKKVWQRGGLEKLAGTGYAPIAGRLGGLQMPKHLRQPHTLPELLLALPQLADDLLRCVPPTSRNHRLRVLPRPSSGIGLSQQMDQYPGPGQMGKYVKLPALAQLLKCFGGWCGCSHHRAADPLALTIGFVFKSLLWPAIIGMILLIGTGAIELVRRATTHR